MSKTINQCTVNRSVRHSTCFFQQTIVSKNLFALHVLKQFLVKCHDQLVKSRQISHSGLCQGNIYPTTIDFASLPLDKTTRLKPTD